MELDRTVLVLPADWFKSTKLVQDVDALSLMGGEYETEWCIGYGIAYSSEFGSQSMCI